MENITLKKIKPVLELTYPSIGPEKGETDYRESLLITSQIKPKQEWDKARNSVALNLIQSRTLLDDAIRHLNKTRDMAKIQYEENDSLWKKLYSREEVLKLCFVKFEQFVCENDDKRTRAIKKIKDEIALQKERTEELGRLKRRHSIILGLKNKLEQNTKDYKIYEDYLNTVIQSSTGQFKQSTDVIKRYDSLVEKRNTVLEKRNRELDDLDQAKVNLLKLVEQRGLEIMTLNSKIVELIRRHEKARNHALRWELVVGEIKHHTKKRQVELDSVLLCIQNMYRQICYRRGIRPDIPDGDFEAQSRLIRSVLEDLQRVHIAAQKAEAADESGGATRILPSHMSKKKVVTKMPVGAGHRRRPPHRKPNQMMEQMIAEQQNEYREGQKGESASVSVNVSIGVAADIPEPPKKEVKKSTTIHSAVDLIGHNK